MRRFFFQSAFLGLLLALPLWSSAARQQKSQDDQPSGESSSRHPEVEQSEDAQQNTAYDPVPAEHDIDVGTFYMRKGDIDAAIARFKDAIRRKSNFAKPRLLLGEAYEKKGDPSTAAKYYKEYLQVSPHAPDAKKIKKKIDKLTSH
jgi:tetratricopeptide (TPR) repeat protein